MPFCVLLVIHRLLASAGVAVLRELFTSWVPESVFGVGGADCWKFGRQNNNLTREDESRC